LRKGGGVRGDRNSLKKSWPSGPKTVGPGEGVQEKQKVVLPRGPGFVPQKKTN